MKPGLHYVTGNSIITEKLQVRDAGQEVLFAVAGL